MSDARIPLLDRHGAVVAESLVDDTDVEALSGFTWRLISGRSGDYAGFGYPRVHMHRWLLGVPPFGESGIEVDHKNRDGLDNRRANLRTGTRAQNLQNKAMHTERGYRGVTWRPDKNKWQASAQLAGRHYHIGYFADEAAAAQAASRWREEHMPFAVEQTAIVQGRLA